jgi:DNA repair photolyase
MITETIAKTVLTGHDEAFPTLWDVNPYRGCTMGCKYCFAQYSHQYLGLTDFFKDIIVKTNVAGQLYRELSKKSWQREQIKLGGICDIYQHCEKKYELMPAIIDVLKKTRNPVFIQTKSTLMYRDLEIITELSKVTTVDISVSVSAFDETAGMIIEPGAPAAKERMAMLRDFKKACRKTIVAMMPVIPFISDTNENLETAFSLTKEYDLENIIVYPLHLRNRSRIDFLNFIQLKFPGIYPEFSDLYKSAEPDDAYKNKLFRKIERLRKKYKLNGEYEPLAKPLKPEQLSLF